MKFESYRPADKQACLKLFDANCPEFFAPNERVEYEGFLDANPSDYELCFDEESVVGAFGLLGDDIYHRDLNWIMLDPSSQGLGIGATIMKRIALNARASGARVVHIAASQKSAPFFSKFGATETTVTENGWGPGMHRVDMELTI